MKETMNFIFEHWVSISGLLALIISRVIPTGKNYDIAKKILDFLDIIIPNLKKGGGRHKTKTFSLIFVLCSLSVYAQTPVIQQSRANMWIAPGVQDTAFIQNTRTNLQNVYGNTGGIYFDKVRNKNKIWDGSAWADIIFSPPLSSVSSVTGTSPISVTNPTTNAVVSMTPASGVASGYVTTGAQTFAGVKTFASSPIAPTPVLGTNNTTISTTAFGFANFWPLGTTSSQTANVQINSSTFDFLWDGTTGGAFQVMSDNAAISDVAGLNGILINDQQSFLQAGNANFFVDATSSGGTGDAVITTNSLERLRILGNGAWTINGTTGTANTQAIVTTGATSSPIWQTINTGSGTTNRVTFWSGTNTLSSDADMTFTGGNTLTATNVIVPTSLTLSAIPIGRMLYTSTSGLVASEAALAYDATNNFATLVNTTSTQSSIIQGGQILLDNVSNSDRLTLNTGEVSLLEGGSSPSQTLQITQTGTVWTMDAVAASGNSRSLAINGYYLNKVGVDVSGATLQGIGSTPVTILAAPGAGLYYHIISISAKMNAGAVQYDFGNNLNIEYASGTGGTYDLTFNFANSGADVVGDFFSSNSSGVYASVNSAVQLSSGSDATQGDGVLTIEIFYAIKSF